MAIIKSLFLGAFIAGTFAAGNYTGWHAHRLSEQALVALNEIEKAKSVIMFWGNGDE
jgi:hypothetical protein